MSTVRWTATRSRMASTSPPAGRARESGEPHQVGARRLLPGGPDAGGAGAGAGRISRAAAGANRRDIKTSGGSRQLGLRPWCLTDPLTLTRWQPDARARKAIDSLWRWDPDPRATLEVQAEIDAAAARGVVESMKLHYYCCPWSPVYVVKWPVEIGGKRLRQLQQLAASAMPARPASPGESSAACAWSPHSTAGGAAPSSEICRDQHDVEAKRVQQAGRGPGCPAALPALVHRAHRSRSEAAGADIDFRRRWAAAWWPPSGPRAGATARL
jgi:hypothetical protein